MLIKHFYELINSELQNEIDISDDPIYKKYKKEDQKKSYAFLVWFLKFYGQTMYVKEYITDGEGDSSCDIIFNKKDSFGKETFYVVQSKWNNKRNSEDMFKSQELKYSINDFETMLRGHRKSTTNVKFNEKYKSLLEHLGNNGSVKFIFLSLCQSNPSCDDNIHSFRKEYGPNIDLEIVDIQKIRKDYIERKYKGLASPLLLETNYNPEESIITLPIERFGEKADRDFIDFQGGGDGRRSYIFILKPKTIYELFEKFKLSLFYKNVRNPLITSSYNKVIKETLEKRPGAFWYFNNGITAITKLVPDVGVGAKNVELVGLQIINGAQTVYSIYLAYKEATPLQKEVMDADARITMRLIRSSDERFNLEITRFTNSQNAVKSYDFMSNDEIQIKIQNESFNTSFWYQRRRGEFKRDIIPSEVNVVTNTTFVIAYIAFYLQNPYMALEKRDKLFVSRLEDGEGLYEEVFNDSTKFDDMLAAYHVYKLVTYGFKSENEEIEKKTGLLKAKTSLTILVVSMTKVLLKQYLQNKYGEESEVNISLYINKAFNIDEPDMDKINLIGRISSICHEHIQDKDTYYIFERILESNDYYIILSNQLKEKGLTAEIMDFIEGRTVYNEELGDEVAVATESKNVN
ncbi:AIPR family protein [Paenibacillus tuaregi]|uniref:AIPR family protein n=1 Tax=Paenibacillus tuaregi TaxID=1816681 RepID=UPI000838D92A|nr:AIPR family protein [Paenibacillus tuaregi]